MSSIFRKKKSTKEIISFKGLGEKLFEVKIVKDNTLNKIILTDDKYNIRNKKVFSSTNLSSVTERFNYIVSTYNKRLSKSS